MPTPLVRALCWAHARRYFSELADVATTLKRRKKAIELSPLALAVRRIDRVFDVEREINGTSIDNRLAVRREHTAPRVAELEAWMREHRAKLSRHDPVAKVMDYMLKDWAAFTRFLDDGRICLANNAAGRSLRGIAMGRKAWLFCGSDRGGQRAAFMYSLIVTAKLNDVDPEAWLADVLSRIAGIPQGRLNELLPWTWRRLREQADLVETLLPRVAVPVGPLDAMTLFGDPRPLWLEIGFGSGEHLAAQAAANPGSG